MPELDTIRGLAILGVVFYHGFYWTRDLSAYSPWERMFLKTMSVGQYGVNLFFCAFRISNHRDFAEHAGTQRLLQTLLFAEGAANSSRLLPDAADSGGLPADQQGLLVDELVVLFQSFRLVRHFHVLYGALVACRGGAFLSGVADGGKKNESTRIIGAGGVPVGYFTRAPVLVQPGSHEIWSAWGRMFVLHMELLRWIGAGSVDGDFGTTHER